MGNIEEAAVRSARGRRCRRKGKRWEQEVALEFRHLYGDKVKRGWQAREGNDAPDVEGVPGWWVEAKHHARVPMRAAFAQAAEAAEGSGLKPVVIAKDSGQEPLAVLRFADFLELLTKAQQVTAGAIQPTDTPESVGRKMKQAQSVLDAYAGVFLPAQPPKA